MSNILIFTLFNFFLITVFSNILIFIFFNFFLITVFWNTLYQNVLQEEYLCLIQGNCWQY
jgi:hypothetical protein